MRIVVLLVFTLLGGMAGLLAGGYAYNLGHPVPTAVLAPAGRSPLDGLQAAHRDVAGALDRHTGRQKWILGGAILGAGVGLIGTILASRARESRESWDGDEPDPTA